MAVSPRHVTSRPEGSRATGLRTVGANFPTSQPRGSDTSALAIQLECQGRKSFTTFFAMSRVSSPLLAPWKRSMGPPGLASKSRAQLAPTSLWK